MSRLWHEGTIEIPQKDGSSKIANYWVKAYDEGSAYGINEGKISKLQITIDGEMVASYDRGWDIEPAEGDEAAQIAYCILLKNTTKLGKDNSREAGHEACFSLQIHKD